MTDQYVVPPPPPDSPLEVTIRTRAGDLELLQKSGGSAAGLSGSSVMIRSRAAPTATETDERKSQTFIWALVSVVGAIVLFFVGFFLVPLLIEQPSGAGTGGQNTGAATSTKGGPATVQEPAYFGHTSFFKEAPDATREFNPYLAATGPIDRALVVATIDALTRSANPAGTLVELTTKNQEGRPLVWGEVAYLMGAPELDQSVMNTLFMRDITVFVWRDKTGIWPGFIAP